MSAAETLFGLSEEIVIVTGGYGLIGRALSCSLHDLGARVVCLEPSVSDKANRSAFGTRDGILSLSADVTDRSSLERALAAVRNHWGAGPTALVNNAGLDSPPNAPPADNGPFETYPETSWDRVMAVNVKGVFLCCQVFGGAMAETGRGSIINVASIYGAVSPDQTLYEHRRQKGEVFFKPAAYAASKSALYNLTRYLAAYWGPRNVRANTVTFAGVFNEQDPQFLAAYAKKIPLRRGPEYARLANMAAPQDYVGAVAFLVSSASSYMTGADLRVDGGFMAL